MTTYVLRPASTSSSTSYWTPYNTTNFITALNPDSPTPDLTYVYRNSTGAKTAKLNMTAATIASDEFVCRVASFVRYKNGTAPHSYQNHTIGRSGTSTWSLTTRQFSSTFSASATTAELAYLTVSYPRTDFNSGVYLNWQDSTDSTASTYPMQTFEVGINVYTAKLHTATSSNTTYSTDNYPTLTSAVSYNVDAWELTANDTQRSIGVEFRIEQGGTGVGTGKLISNWYSYLVASASGAGSGNVVSTSPTSMSNGTYKFYVRPLRWRESGQSASDTTGAWSSAYTLTVSAPGPNAPTLTTALDQTADKVTLTVTPVATAGFTSPTIDVQRSSDNGNTWTAVRNATSVAATFGSPSTFVDYEAPRGVSVLYRARVSGTSSGLINGGDWTTATGVTLTLDGWNLKCPTNPTLNVVNVAVVGSPDETQTEEIGVFRPMGRAYAVTVAGSIGGKDGSIQLETATAAEWTAISALLSAQQVIYLESPFGWSKYIRNVGGIKSTIKGTSTTPRRTVSIDYVETGTP